LGERVIGRRQTLLQQMPAAAAASPHSMSVRGVSARGAIIRFSD
jgi:hypothetical protein